MVTRSATESFYAPLPVGASDRREGECPTITFVEVAELVDNE
jgi:hypothetical protein